MRIPICQADLPVGFNKIAKYIGRHWPGRSLKFGESRERLANMLGYSNAYAVSRELVAEESIKVMAKADIVQAVCSRDLSLWNVDPIAFVTLMQRVPWHEITAGRSDPNGNR